MSENVQVPPQHAVLHIVQPIFGALTHFDESVVSLSGWYQVFEEYCTANGINEEPAAIAGVIPHNQKRAIFLSHVGPRAYEILRRNLLPDLPNTRSIPELMAILTTQYEPQGLVATNRYSLSCRNQQDSESVSTYISVLQELASKCAYGAFLPQALKDRLIAGIKYPDVRAKLLGTPELTWDNAKTIAIQAEEVKLQAKVLAQSTNIHQVHQQRRSPNPHQARRPFHNSHAASPPRKPSSQKPGPGQQGKNYPPRFHPCHRCGKLHDVRTCPAINWTCYTCQKIGHAAEVCRSSRRSRASRIHGVQSGQPQDDTEQESPEEEAFRLVDFKRVQVISEPVEILDTNGVRAEYRKLHGEQPESVSIVYPKQQDQLEPVVAVSTISDNTKGVSELESQAEARIAIVTIHSINDSPALYCEVIVESQPIRMEIDNGSGASLMSLEDFSKLIPNVELHKSKTILRSVTTPITTAGEAMVKVLFQGKEFKLPLIVCKDTPQFVPLLGRSWLEVLRPGWREALSLQATEAKVVTHESPPSVEKLRELFPAPFATNTDSSIIGYTAHLTLKDRAIPVFARAYQVPYGLLDQVNKHLDNQIESGKLVPVSQSDWASPAVIVRKQHKGNSDGIRYCIDFKRTVNPSLKVDKHPIPNPEDAFHVLSGGKFFTSLDLSDAYTQLELDSDSQELCVVNTHRGLFKYTRLIYGLASAASIFQNCLDVILAGIEGVICYIDNIAIMGRTMAECVQRTMLVLARLDKHNVRLRLDKCEWFVEQFEYLGYIVSGQGRTPTPGLHKDILEAPSPTDIRSLRSFLGCIGFYAKFIPDFSTIANPMRKLTETGVPFVWTKECEVAFCKCKELLTSNALLVHYDPSLPIVVMADASPVGVGAVLAHRVVVDKTPVEKPILFASSSLSKTQQNYAQIDREALAVIFAVSKFYKYLWGRKFTLVTDNSAIQRIFNPDRSLPVRTDHRLQHWATLLQPYDFKLIHRSSKFLAPADALSRLPGPACIQDSHVVFSLGDDLPLNPEVIAAKSKVDPVLREVLQITRVGWPNHLSDKESALNPFFKVRDSLTIQDGCLLHAGRVVIPQGLRKEVLSMLHEGHPGTTRSKLLARSLLWWPGINQDIEMLCQSCPSCTIVNFKPKKDYIPWPPGKQPFERVHVDFFHFKQTTYFIYCDSYSKWLTVIQMSSLTAQAVIETLSGIFSIWGLPHTCVSDNGPPFCSNDYVQFCTKLNITVKHSCVGHPEGNGLAERGVQIAKKALSKLVLDIPQSNGPSTESLAFKVQQFLFNYRNTPTTTTLKSPNEMLLLFKPRTMLTQLVPKANPNTLPLPMSHFREGDPVHVRLHKTPVKGVIVRQIGPHRFHVSVEGVIKQAHFNQLTRAL